jgi:hypothetical protein
VPSTSAYRELARYVERLLERDHPGTVWEVDLEASDDGAGAETEGEQAALLERCRIGDDA